MDRKREEGGIERMEKRRKKKDGEKEEGDRKKRKKSRKKGGNGQKERRRDREKEGKKGRKKKGADGRKEVNNTPCASLPPFFLHPSLPSLSASGLTLPCEGEGGRRGRDKKD